MAGRLAVLAGGIANLLVACDSEVAPTAALIGIPVTHKITAESAGPIGAATPYSREALGRLFPGAEIETVRTADETGVSAAMAIYEDGVQVFQVLPDESGAGLRAVHGSGIAVAGPNGERPGVTFAETEVSRDDCTAGSDVWAGMVVCSLAGVPNVRLVFDNGGWSGPESRLPPARVLARGRLHRIIWEPPPSG